jgi:hypothetical protein
MVLYKVMSFDFACILIIYRLYENVSNVGFWHCRL